MATEVRIDKWLWAARLYKTRPIATEACKKGRICQNGNTLKPSRMIKAGDIIDIRKPPVTWSFKVLKPIENRVGAKLVLEVLENVTPANQLELYEMSRLAAINGRARGTGRPTKKDRRNLDDFSSEGSSPIVLTDDSGLDDDFDFVVDDD